MALILQIETATTVCSVALSYKGVVISVQELNKGYTHAEQLTILIEQVMKDTSTRYAQLDAIALSKGPGSYTGLRIGVAVAKGLCYGLNKPLIAINTLESMVYGMRHIFPDIHYYCPMLDARRMEVYTALYDWEMNKVHATQAKILDTNSFVDVLDHQKIIFFGDGAPKFKAICKHPQAVFDTTFAPSASYLSTPAFNRFKLKEFEDTAYFEPFYLKEFYNPSKKL